MELLSPGVFIEERQSQLQQITAVSTSNFATIGWTPKGPSNQATLVTSLQNYIDTFGEVDKWSDTFYGIVGFFQNGGQRAYVVRVVADDAVAAYASMDTKWLFTAKSEGKWGNLIRVTLSGNDNYYDVDTATYSRFDVSVSEETTDGGADFTVVETFEAVDLTDEDSANYIVTVMNSETTGSDYITVTKVNGGIPTNLESVQISNESIGSGDGATQAFNHTMAQTTVAYSTIQVNVNGVLTAQDDGEGNIEGVSGSSVTGTIDYEDGSLTLFFVSAPAGGTAITVDYYQAPTSAENADLANGSDGTPSNIDRDQISSPLLADDKAGIYAFDEIDEFLNIGLMDFSADTTIGADLIAYAETRKDCFIVMDCGESKTALQANRFKRNTLNSQSDYAALYWPRIQVADVLKNNVPKIISPVGHIIGRYAYTDINQTVGKAPAGVNDGQLNGILGLEFKTTKGDRDVVYPAGVNPLREDAFVGRAIWGGKTLQIVGDFTRVHVRRLFIFLEKSTFGSTHDLVFENIGPQLFSTVKLRMDGFLTPLYQDGYFGSDATTPEQAFRVICDDTNNTEATIAAGQLITDVLVRPNFSSEFVRFRFQRKVSRD